jgi:hypothetical protein
VVDGSPRPSCSRLRPRWPGATPVGGCAECAGSAHRADAVRPKRRGVRDRGRRAGRRARSGHRPRRGARAGDVANPARSAHRAWRRSIHSRRRERLRHGASADSSCVPGGRGLVRPRHRPPVPRQVGCPSPRAHRSESGRPSDNNTNRTEKVYNAGMKCDPLHGSDRPVVESAGTGRERLVTDKAERLAEPVGAGA